MALVSRLRALGPVPRALLWTSLGSSPWVSWGVSVYKVP